MRKYLTLLVAILLTTSALWAQHAPAPQPDGRHRLFVLSDIGNEPDDQMSMVRLMLYSNSIDLEGLAATTSTHMRTRVNTHIIYNVVDAYSRVRPNLLLHQEGYPTAEYLRSIITSGPARYGMEAVGEGQTSEAASRLIACLKKDDERPLWVAAWGGTNVLAQALDLLRNSCSAKELQRLIRKLRVYAISDQDDTGLWLRTQFPDLFYICSPWAYDNSTWHGINDGAYDATKVSQPWLLSNIRQGHGPLGACYPQMSFAMEGDTPSFLGLIPNGLNAPEHPDWGGWGGRYELRTPEVSLDQVVSGVPHPTPETHPIWTDAIDTWKPYRTDLSIFMQLTDTTCYHSNHATVYRWRDAMQNDFAARMRWCHTSYEEANHAPVVRVLLNGRDLPEGEVVHLKSGEHFSLDATPTTDPDDDSRDMYWFQYQEAGDCPGTVLPRFVPNQEVANDLYAPTVSKACTAHVILQVTDNGTPALTSYRRIVFRIEK